MAKIEAVERPRVNRSGVSDASAVAEAVAVLEEFLAEVEPARFSSEDAAVLVDGLARGERLCATGKALFAKRVAETNGHRRLGHRSAAHWLAEVTGDAMGAAAGSLELADKMEAHPGLSKALRAGELTTGRARQVADALDVAPTSEQELLDAARKETFRQLRDRCAHAKARARSNEDANAAYDRIRASRFLRHRTETDGAFSLEARLTPDDGASVLAALAPIHQAVFDEARRQGIHERTEAYGADALVALLTGARTSVSHNHAQGGGTLGSTAPSSTPLDSTPLNSRPPDSPPPDGARPDGAPPDNAPPDHARPDGAPPDHARPDGAPPDHARPDGAPPDHARPNSAAPHDDRTEPGTYPERNAPDTMQTTNTTWTNCPRATVQLTVDLAALRRGHLGDGERCEIPGVGQVPLATAENLLGDAIVDLVVTKGADIAAVCHLGRTVPAALRTALVVRDPTCVVPGCDVRQGLEIDHRIIPFAKGGPTALWNLARLCRHHHYLRTHKGFRLEGGPGTWRWLAPDDPQDGPVHDGHHHNNHHDDVHDRPDDHDVPPTEPPPASPRDDQAPSLFRLE